MKNVTSKPSLFWLAPIIALIIGIFPMPYGYYMISRLIVSGCALYYAVSCYKNNYKTHLWIFGLIVVLYNPLIPISLGSKELWMVVNIPTIIYFYLNRNN